MCIQNAHKSQKLNNPQTTIINAHNTTILPKGYPYTIATSTEIFRPPNDTTVFLDSIAVFMCEVNGGLASWRVNGTFYNSLSAEIRSDLDTDQEAGAGGNEILTVTVPGRAEYNGTRVQCYTIIPGSASVESRTVIMTVQGTS